MSENLEPCDDRFVAVLAEIREFVAARDWGQYHTPKNLAAAVAVEAGELLGHFRWLSPEESTAILDDPVKRRAIESEIADVLILALEMADVCGVDPATAIRAKLAVNASRYPVERSKGRHAKYDEL
ncbi:MAG: nucleotide pyrophosphohydrolase [Phycisphaerae bacterium]|nr:nucleotide pyrophosphohydrolase [Phycisphaerae bacterium]